MIGLSNQLKCTHILLSEFERCLLDEGLKRSDSNHIQKARFHAGSADIDWYGCNGVTRSQSCKICFVNFCGFSLLKFIVIFGQDVL